MIMLNPHLIMIVELQFFKQLRHPEIQKHGLFLLTRLQRGIMKYCEMILMGR